MPRRNRQFNCAPDRRRYDVALCEATTHWAPLRTSRDGPQYGHWANPSSWTLFSYADHNAERLDCDSLSEFQLLVEQLAARHGAEWRGIDPRTPELRDRFAKAGLKDLLVAHADDVEPDSTTHRPRTTPSVGVQPRTLTASSEHFPEGVEPLGEAFEPRIQTRRTARHQPEAVAQRPSPASNRTRQAAIVAAAHLRASSKTPSRR